MRLLYAVELLFINTSKRLSFMRI